MSSNKNNSSKYTQISTSEVQMADDPNSNMNPKYELTIADVHETSSPVEAFKPVDIESDGGRGDPQVDSQPEYTAQVGCAGPGGVTFSITPVEIYPNKKPVVHGKPVVVKQRRSIRISEFQLVAIVLCCFCTICFVIPITLAVLLGHHLKEYVAKDFLYFTLSTGSTCVGNQVYQYAYPTETCIPLTGNQNYSSLQINHFSSNATMNYYNDTSCSTLQSQRVVVYNRCQKLSRYGGSYSISAYYRSGTYLSTLTQVKLTAKGYSSGSCKGKITEMIAVVLATCLPISQTESVKYIYNPPTQSCYNSQQGIKCTQNPATMTKTSYNTSSCASRLDSNTFILDGDGTYCVASGDEVSPYRTYDIPALFH